MMWKWTCDSFPEGIPDEIVNGGFDHREQFSSEKLLWKFDGSESALRLYEDCKEAGILFDGKPVDYSKAKPARRPKFS